MAYFHGRPAHLKNWSIFMGGLPIQKTCSIFAGGLLIFNFKLGLNPFIFSKNQYGWSLLIFVYRFHYPSSWLANHVSTLFQNLRLNHIQCIFVEICPPFSSSSLLRVLISKVVTLASFSFQCTRVSPYELLSKLER